MTHQESQIQQMCVKYFRLKHRKLALSLFACPNGGGRNKIEAAIMKGEGVVSGVADLLLLHPSGKYHGLCIEMKTPSGKQSPNQRTWQYHIEQEGYKYIICRSLDDFMKEIDDYLFGEKEEKKPVQHLPDKQEDMKRRRDAFTETMRAFADKYDGTMLNEFWQYWTEPNKSHTKMRFEMQPTWDLARRLLRWDKNNAGKYKHHQ